MQCRNRGNEDQLCSVIEVAAVVGTTHYVRVGNGEDFFVRMQFFSPNINPDNSKFSVPLSKVTIAWLVSTSLFNHPTPNCRLIIHARLFPTAVLFGFVLFQYLLMMFISFAIPSIFMIIQLYIVLMSSRSRPFSVLVEFL